MALAKHRRWYQQQQQELLDLLVQLEGNAHLWLTYFLQDSLPPNPLPKIKIFWEEKELTYGRYALDNIQQTQQNLLSKLHSKQLTFELYQQQVQILQQKLREIRCTRPLQGFFAPDYSITIYPTTIQKIAKQNSWDYQGYLASVMLHEMFHAYHYRQITMLHKNSWIILDSTLKAKVNTVKEALACYAQYSWLAEQACQGPLIALYNDARNIYHCYPSYPYAGLCALLEGKADTKPREKFQAVYQQSLHDWQTAYKLLDSPSLLQHQLKN